MTPGTTDWAGVVVTAARADVPAETIEVLGALLLGLGAAGLEETSSGLTAYFPVDARLDERFTAAAAHAARLLGAGASVQRHPVPAVDWVANWKREVRATPVADGIVVAPTWDPYVARDGEVVIRLDPGMAFGTGSHPSTRLCLAALAARPPRGARVLDLGTGSGILAIAAARLGARQVLAVDNDPVATAVAAENVELNRVGEVVETRTGDLSSCEGTFDVVVANILAGPLVQMCEGIAARVREGGAVILSGLLATEADQVAGAYRRAGLVPRQAPVERDGSGLEWAALVLER